jgi:hypothetical protein
MNQGFGLPYPIYPNYQGMMPNMMNQPTIILNNDCSNNTDLSSIERKINNLEKRITSIENYINNSNNINNNYNSSNYQML